MLAVVVSYLLVSVPASSAAIVRVYDPIGTEWEPWVGFSPGNLVEREVSVDPGTETLSYSLKNGSSSVSVEGAWLYRCRDRGPYDCMAGPAFEIDGFPGNVQADYAWDDVSANGVANLLCFARLNKGGDPVWLAFWSSVERDGQGFDVREGDISEIEIHASDMGMISTIKSFVGRYLMIPMNPDWVSRVVLRGASSVYEISMDGEDDIDGPDYSTAGYREITGDGVGSVSREYGFMLPVVSSGVRNPVTLYSNPSYTCGMLGCESGRGEDSGNCCLDCPCAAGYYCDVSAGCRRESDMGLELYSDVEPRVVDCFESHTVSIPVRVRGAPSGYSKQSWCRVGGRAYESCTCAEVSDDVYTCSVNVPVFGGCGSGDFRVTNNAVRFRIDYMDGNTPREKYVETAFGDITIGSFECGMNGCESGLGEDSGNCCLDCGCAAGYCDYRAGDDPSSGVCRVDPSGGDVTGVVKPMHFSDHSPGDSVLVDINIGSMPKTFTLDDVSCQMGCIYDNTVDCDSSCTVDYCDARASEDPGIFNLSCSLSFSVTDYNSTRDYMLSPEMTFDVHYMNGSLGDAYMSIDRTFSYISIGPHWCGDIIYAFGSCFAGEEDYTNCCYDCPCPAGQYCDTASTDGPSGGDGCRSGFTIGLDSAGSLSWDEDYTEGEHTIPVLMHVGDAPRETTMDDFALDCMIANGEFPCSLDCVPVPSVDSDDYNMSCGLVIPSIDYVGNSHYDSVSQEMRFSENSINLSFSYNNGSRREVEPFDYDLGEAVIRITTTCGINDCEHEWENQTNCCRDCGCSDFGEDYFCYLGASHNGECVSTTDIDMRVLGSEPDPWECVIARTGGDCLYGRDHTINIDVLNSPPDAQIADVTYSIDDGEPRQGMACIKAPDYETVNYGKWNCSFRPEEDPVEVNWSQELEGAVERKVNVSVTVSYTLGGEEKVKSMYDERLFTTEKVKLEALSDCEDEIERLNDTINDLRNKGSESDRWGMLFKMMGAVAIAVGIALAAECGWWGGCSAQAYMLIAMGLLMIVLGNTGEVFGLEEIGDTQISYWEDLLQAKEEECASTGFEETQIQMYRIDHAPPVSTQGS
jgi:hypothetical protein